MSEPTGRRRAMCGMGAAAAAAGFALSGCVTLKIGSDAPSQIHLRLTDAGIAATARLSAPLVATLLIQPLAGDALGDSVSIAFARQPGYFEFYQYSSWTERPVRQLPRLLQQRLEARGTAGAVALVGEPLNAQWLLRLGVDTIHHDASASPGMARLGLVAELVDRRERTRLARQVFQADTALARSDAAAAADAMAQSVGRAFDALLPWLEAQLAQPR